MIFMKYLDYRGMKEYYTIDEVCRLFEISKQELKHYADKLHNFIYKEQYNQPRTSSQPDSRKDPWA